MKKRLICIGTVVLLLLSTLAVFTASAVTPRSETLIVNFLSGPDWNPGGFNRWVGWANWDKGLQNILNEALWTVDYVTGEEINTLAKEAPIYNDDFTELTIKLREGIYWSDGIELTADDLVFTVQTLMANPGMYFHDAFNLFVDSVYKTDNYTVVFELSKANNRFHQHFVDRWGACYIMPKHIWKNVDDPLTYQFNPPVFTGPYALTDYDPAGAWYIYERRADWERSATGRIFGEPKPKYVQFVALGTDEKKVIAQSRHELDMTGLSPESLKVALKTESVRGYFPGGFPLGEIYHPCTIGGAFNSDAYPYSIKEVRWALILALDIVSISMSGYDGSIALAPFYAPATLANYQLFYEPLRSWAEEEFTLKVGDMDYHPFDSNISFRIAEAVEARGYPVPEDPAEIKKLFGYGWWKYAPEVAEQLLINQGFSKDSDGKWLLPDGSPWEIQILVNPPGGPADFVIADQWRRFGIEAEVQPTEGLQTLAINGEFVFSTGVWPIYEPLGGPDLYRSLNHYRSEYHTPIGEPAAGFHGRWSDPRLDEILDEMEVTDVNDPATTELTIEALKIVIEEMPGFPLASYPDFISWDTYYWTNYPGGENPYGVPHYHWPNLKFMLPFLEPTGNE